MTTNPNKTDVAREALRDRPRNPAPVAGEKEDAV